MRDIEVDIEKFEKIANNCFKFIFNPQSYYPSFIFSDNNPSRYNYYNFKKKYILAIDLYLKLLISLSKIKNVRYINTNSNYKLKQLLIDCSFSNDMINYDFASLFNNHLLINDFFSPSGFYNSEQVEAGDNYIHCLKLNEGIIGLSKDISECILFENDICFIKAMIISPVNSLKDGSTSFNKFIKTYYSLMLDIH